MRTYPADYSQRNFFPADRQEEAPDARFGAVLQAVAGKRGRGRVLAFTDSTVFSNFFMFIPGKPELALGSVEWLNRANRWPALPTGLLFSGLLGLTALAGWRRRRPHAGATGAVLLGALAALPLALHRAAWANRAAYPLPTAREPHVRVCFDLEHSQMHLPSTSLVPRSPQPDYLSFFVCVQRLGWFPYAAEQLVEGLAKRPDLVVLLNPKRPLEEGAAQALQSYVRGGGRLLVVGGVGPPPEPPAPAEEPPAPLPIVVSAPPPWPKPKDAREEAKEREQRKERLKQTPWFLPAEVYIRRPAKPRTAVAAPTASLPDLAPTNAVVKPFGLSLRARKKGRPGGGRPGGERPGGVALPASVVDRGGKEWATIATAWKAEGGEGVWRLGKATGGKAEWLLTQRRYGTGTVSLLADATLLQPQAIGGTTEDPNPEQRKYLAMAFQLLREAAGFGTRRREEARSREGVRARVGGKVAR